MVSWTIPTTLKLSCVNGHTNNRTQVVLPGNSHNTYHNFHTRKNPMDPVVSGSFHVSMNHLGPVVSWSCIIRTILVTPFILGRNVCAVVNGNFHARMNHLGLVVSRKFHARMNHLGTVVSGSCITRTILVTHFLLDRTIRLRWLVEHLTTTDLYCLLKTLK